MSEEKARIVLLPCPFCGAPPRESTYKDESSFSHDQVDWYSIACHHCDYRMSDEDHEELVARWSQRYDP